MISFMRRVIAGCVAAASLLLAAAPASAEPVTFFGAQYLDQTFPGGEPVVQVDTVHHTIVYSAHEGTTHIYRPGLPAAETLNFFSEYRNQTKMWVSHDGGVSFKRIDFNGTGFATDPTKNTGFSDPDLAIDASGRIYNTGINLANDALFSSGDGGDTWDKGTIFCSSADRPWLAGGRKDQAWMSSNTNLGGHQVFESTDGGNSCGTSGIKAPGGNGKIYYDHVRDVLIEPAQTAGRLGINVIKPGGAATFKGGVEGTSLYAHWPAIAQDGAGTVYLVWDTDDRTSSAKSACGDDQPVPNTVKMISTRDLGETWSKPVTIAAPAGKRVFWPWVAAGDAGKVSIVWYQTDKVADLACEGASISIYHATVLNADDDARRTVETVDAVGRPISVATSICQNGTLCVATGEDRRLGDFFTNAIDERGCAVIASGDTMIKDADTGGERHVAAPLYIRQATGPRLIGTGDCSARAGAQTPGAGGKQPPGSGVPLPSRRSCVAQRRFQLRLRAPKGQRVKSYKVLVNGKRARVVRRHGRRYAIVRLRPGTNTVKVTALTAQGRRVVTVRRYRRC
jgi:hypothetical protein